MNLLFDLGHPAHFHLFKNLIFALKKDKHRVIITAKDQPVLNGLLQDSGLDFINLGQKGHSIRGKALKQLWFDWRIWQIAWKNKVDIGLGVTMSVPQAAIFSKMRSIVFDDDDFAVTPLFYRYAHGFADHVISPDCLSWQKGGSKYIYYNGNHELAYLHPARFSPDPDITKKVGIKPDERYFILRFNSYNAYHDTEQFGFSNQQKETLIQKLSDQGRVFITSENFLQESLNSYLIKLHPSEMHSFMAGSTLFISDSQTMTSEAAVLGIPSLRLSSLAGKLSSLIEVEEKFQLTFAFHPLDFEKMLVKIDELLGISNLREEWQMRKNIMLEYKIDVTGFFYWLVKNYPESIEKIKKEPEFLSNFK